MNNFDYKNLTPFKWFVLENFPFIENDFDAINNYHLFSKVVEYLNNTIDSMNLTGEQMENVTNAMTNLQDYVNNYFDNLDVQDEIDNKLDEMAEDGTLQEIITAYLNVKGILAYNTVLDMKNATNIVDGSFVKTYGNLTYNDGKGEFYKIREVTNEDVIDEINIIAINTNNQLVAELMKNYTIEQIENEIEQIENEIEILREDLNVYGVAPYGDKNKVWFQYYVDNVNGDDTNEGTQANPFKTIDPILAKINKGFLKIDICLKRGQTHLLNGTTFNACTLHFNVYGDGNDNAIITTNHGTSGQSLVFYNCHGNFTNITFTNIGVDMYFDGGSLSANNSIFDCKFTSWGCGCRFENCTIKTLKTRMANIWAYGDNNIIGCVDSYASVHVWYKPKLTPSYAINHDEPNACYSFYGGSLLIYGSTSIVTNDIPAYNRLLIFNGLTFCLSAGPATTTTGTHFSQQSEMSCCKIITNSARLNTLSTSANGITYTNGTEYPT